MKAYDFDITKESSRAFMLTGNDLYLRDSVIRSFKSLVPEEHRFFNLKVIEDLRGPDELKDAMSTFTMFDSPIVIFVEDGKFKDKGDDSKTYVQLLSNIPDGVYAVINTDEKLPSNIKKVLTEIDCKIDFKPANIATIKNICLKIAKDLSLSISNKALDTIIQYCNGDIGRISMELEKLSYYKLGKPIEFEDVDLMVENTMDNQIYELSNAISNNEFLKARQMLDRFIEKGVPYAVIRGSLTGFYRRMLHISLSNLKDAELAEIFGVHEYSIKVARTLSRKYTQIQLMDIVKDLVEAEYLHRYGVIDEVTAFKNVIAKLMTKN